MSGLALSNEQRAIVYRNEGEGAVLVEAAAGSGKTRILTERVRYLLTGKKNKFFSVLCLTFTNKAADEMKERLKEVPKKDERTFIGTFHEFCLNIVRTRHLALGFAEPPHLFDENDTQKVLEEVLLQNPTLKEKYQFSEATNETERKRKQRDLLFKCKDFISEAKRKLEEVSEFETTWKDWSEGKTLLFQDYNRRLRNQNAMDYDDILWFTHKILSENPSIANLYRRTYAYILIDEAQDLNYAQYQILKAICGETHKNLMMVGDPKQAIYGFNGASAEFMQQHFVQDFAAEKVAIQHNYRSARKILELAEKIQPNGGVGNNYFEGICEVKVFEHEEAEARWVLEQIRHWQNTGSYQEPQKEIAEPVGLQDIVVMARNKYVFAPLMQLLDADEELKNRYFLKKGVERFEPESMLMKVFDLGLRLLTNPKDMLHFQQMLDVLKLSDVQTANALDYILSLDTVSCALPAEDCAMLATYWRHLQQHPKSLGWVLEKIESNLSQRPENEYVQSLEMALFDVHELQKFWKAFSRSESADNQTLTNFRYFLALNGSKEAKQGLTLATVHTTKGLEFSIAFLIGMNEGVFPDYRAKTDTQLKEEKNNAYVAVTRAKRVLYLTYPESKQMPWGTVKPQKPSSFIKGF